LDRDRMNQVLIHLLSYLRQHSTLSSSIMITLHQEAEEVIVHVQDRDAGIAEGLLPHIFEPFQRLPQIETEAGTHPDLGLGLYLSQQVVERHGGHIEFQSSTEEGSTFSVVLPLAVQPTTEPAISTAPVNREPVLFQPPRWLVS
jgi:signal transduction histidine kinase